MSQENRQPGSASDAFQKASSADSSRLLAARRHGRSVREQRKDGEAPREREVNLGGLTLQLHVHGEIPGHKLVWENDDNGAIETRLQQGFDFVLQSELNERQAKIVPDEEISSVISRFVKGTRNDGQALRAYLLKIPMEQWEELENQRYMAADEWDRAIRQQAEHPDEKAGMRSLKTMRSTVDTGFRKEYSLGERARRSSED